MRLIVLTSLFCFISLDVLAVSRDQCKQEFLENMFSVLRHEQCADSIAKDKIEAKDQARSCLCGAYQGIKSVGHNAAEVGKGLWKIVTTNPFSTLKRMLEALSDTPRYFSELSDYLLNLKKYYPDLTKEEEAAVECDAYIQMVGGGLGAGSAVKLAAKKLAASRALTTVAAEAGTRELNISAMDSILSSCPQCPKKVIVNALTEDHVKPHFGTAARPGKPTTVFPNNLSYNDVLTSIERGNKWKPIATENLDVAFFKVDTEISGQKYKVRVLICKVAICPPDDPGLPAVKRGEVIAIYPECGPGVLTLPSLEEQSRGRLPIKKSC